MHILLCCNVEGRGCRNVHITTMWAVHSFSVCLKCKKTLEFLTKLSLVVVVS